MHEIHWGLLVASYLFLAGTSAGALFVSGYYVMANRIADDKYCRLAKASALAGTVLLILGICMIVLDLTTFRYGISHLEFDRLFRFFRLFMVFVPGSIMSWGTWLLALSIPVALMFVSSFSPKSQFSHLRKLLATFNMLFAVGIASYTAFLLGDVVSNIVWNNSVLVILFMISALSCGMAVVLFLRTLLWKHDIQVAETTTFAKTDAAILAVELLTVLIFIYFVFTASKVEQVSFIFSPGQLIGQYWWVGAITLGLIIPLLMNIFAVTRQKLQSQAFEYLMVVCLLSGAFCLRYSILLAGQSY